MAVYFTYLKPGDTVLGMDLSHGGHLTHGSPVNFSGKFYKFIPYGIDKETGMIDYNRVEELAYEHKPKMITVGASAYSRSIDYKAFRQIADKVGAFLFADIAVNKVVERGDPVLLKEGTELHIAPHAKITVVLTFDRAHMCVVALIAQLTVLIAGTDSTHSFRIFHFEALSFVSS